MMTAESNGVQAVENQEDAEVAHKRISSRRSVIRIRRRIEESSAMEFDKSDTEPVDMEAPENFISCGLQSVKEDSGRRISEISKKDDSRLEKDGLTENIFSLIFIAPVSSAAFWFAIFVSLFQIFMPTLALFDLIRFSDSLNPLQAPNGASVQVRICGAMALVLAVTQYFDFMEAIKRLQMGPPQYSIQKPRGASCW